jgi:RimJ/RimL family protein N-acetyltransferase
VALRPVEDDDLSLFFVFERDPIAIYLAAFTAEDPDDEQRFRSHWARIRQDPQIINRTVVVDGKPVGHIAAYGEPAEREVTYWLDRAVWGRGIATAALGQFLQLETTRPLHARVADGNDASLRVLQRCGFAIVGHGSGFAHGRGAETEEYLLTLHGGAG